MTLPSHQPQAGRHHVHVIREMGHQLRRPFERDGLVVEAEHAAEAVLADPHQRQLDELRDQRLLHELAGPLAEREQHLSGEDQGQQVELVARQPRHDARLDPTENHSLYEAELRTDCSVDCRRKVLSHFLSCGSLLGVESLELVFALVDGLFFFLDDLFRLGDQVVDVFLDRLVLKQDRDDRIGRRRGSGPKIRPPTAKRPPTSKTCGDAARRRESIVGRRSRGALLQRNGPRADPCARGGRHVSHAGGKVQMKRGVEGASG